MSTVCIVFNGSTGPLRSLEHGRTREKPGTEEQGKYQGGRAFPCPLFFRVLPCSNERPGGDTAATPQYLGPRPADPLHKVFFPCLEWYPGSRMYQRSEERGYRLRSEEHT